MLVLERKPGESFVIDEVIKVKINSVRNGSVKIGITAPKRHNVRRSELPHNDPGKADDEYPTLAAPADQCLHLLDRLFREKAVIAVRDNYLHLFDESGSLLAHGADIEELCASALQSGL